jgi:phospholipase C
MALHVDRTHYGDMTSGTFKGDNSQHPLDGISPGEVLIKETYEAIRNWPHWDSSLLIITWDEHGGFFDHVAPPAARREPTPPSRPPTLRSRRVAEATARRTQVRELAVALGGDTTLL